MKPLRLPLPTFVSLLLAGTLAGCAMTGQHGSMGHHASQGMDMKSMCDMHKKEMAGKTAAEQQALMQEHMKSMAPEMRERMQEMMAQCK